MRASAASETVYDNRSESGGLDLFDPQGLAGGVVNIHSYPPPPPPPAAAVAVAVAMAPTGCHHSTENCSRRARPDPALRGLAYVVFQR
ncbi:hypothetical protein ONA91_40190 [Micromonospora sp. DR5-3]|uniref:hypothetical protein n=1 Tax=unclassified Micromonospora TaxID=2617518 RepID=UPI0011D883F3|nr:MULTISPECIES: hypothetical protein [unclassified Micromonospora]MCW3820664.1 hypothetical protein [Micromonospora sp. DR5-3]TYC11350.1 hypothetical protein FXF52_40490 [Micromonospora sp. MP36]